MGKKSDKTPKKVVIVSDLHCGHRAGLTPPQWQTKPDDEVPQKAKWARTQETMWAWYYEKMVSLRPIHLLVCNGDAIEGKGARSESTELITADRTEQAEMAVQCLSVADAKQYRMVRGTSSHVGPGEDYEDIVAFKLGCKVGDHEWFDINGLVFDCKHYIPGFSMPHTKATAGLGDALWNMVWAENGNVQPKSDVIVRSHLHSFYDVSGVVPNQRIFVTPALQGFGSKYGARQCRRLVHVGLIEFNVTNEREWTWKVHLMDMKSQAASAEVL